MQKNQRTTLWWIHGTLQRAASWDSVLQANPDLQALAAYRCIQVPDLDTTSLEAWANDFNMLVSAAGTTRNVAVGYSLGGRLALHACLQSHNLWNGVICVGGHPGPQTADEAEAMAARDAGWQQLLRSAGPAVFLQRWNAAPLFGNTPGPPGQQCPDDTLTQIYWGTLSKAHQKDLRPALRTRLACDVLYISGARDHTYSSIGTALAEQCPRLQSVTIADAGHRVPWDQPVAFGQAVMAWLRERR